MPFITEEIYQERFRRTEKDKSIHLSKWPETEKAKQKDLDIVHKFGPFVDVIQHVRKWKSDNKKPMNSQIILTLSRNEFEILNKYFFEDLKHVTNAKEIKEGKQFRVDFTDKEIK